MDRTKQLSNVSFGGAWSEQIAGNERLTDAMRCIDEAVAECDDRDLRQDQNLRQALAEVAASHPKGRLLSQAWEKGLGLQNPGLRTAELKRLAAAFRVGLGNRLKD